MIFQGLLKQPQAVEKSIYIYPPKILIFLKNGILIVKIKKF